MFRFGEQNRQSITATGIARHNLSVCVSRGGGGGRRLSDLDQQPSTEARDVTHPLCAIEKANASSKTHTHTHTTHGVCHPRAVLPTEHAASEAVGQQKWSKWHASRPCRSKHGGAQDTSWAGISATPQSNNIRQCDSASTLLCTQRQCDRQQVGAGSNDAGIYIQSKALC